jgi:acyl-CoA reductase-like NAD-dependent aldehyde dehydrogenase
MIGFSSFQALMRKILNYINIGKEVDCISGGEAGNYEGDLVQILCSTNGIKGTNNMRVFQEEIFLGRL